MLYAIKVGKKWSLVRNKREAIRTAKRNPGAVVWSRDDAPEVNDAWDWLAFIIGATRIY